MWHGCGYDILESLWWLNMQQSVTSCIWRQRCDFETQVQDYRPENSEHKFSPGDSCKSKWPLTIWLCDLLTNFCFNVYIAGTNMRPISHCHWITWIRPATSGGWRIYTPYSVLPSMFWGCLKECGGLSVLLSMVPDLLWVLNKYSNTSLFHHWLYQGLESFPSLIKGIFRCSASTGLPITTEELTLHSKFLPTGLASRTCVLKEIHSTL